jgi:hypothetical protein
MATENKRAEDDRFLAEKRANWSGFLRLSTYAIVGVSVALIVMALFLLG